MGSKFLQRQHSALVSHARITTSVSRLFKHELITFQSLEKTATALQMALNQKLASRDGWDD